MSYCVSIKTVIVMHVVYNRLAPNLTSLNQPLDMATLHTYIHVVYDRLSPNLTSRDHPLNRATLYACGI